MSTVPISLSKDRDGKLPLLENGDHMTQAEFHRRYQAYPDHVKIELIGGVVYVASPLRRRHGSNHCELITTLGLYKAATKGIEILDNATTILGKESEPQPDLSLRILPEFGGQTKTDPDDYVVGAPEWLGEIAASSRTIDLGAKKKVYRKAGVLEYLVVCLEEEELFWFDFPTDDEIQPNRKGIYRSRVFPGLWLDGPALLAGDSLKLIEVVQKGIASREHTAFVKRLQKAFKKTSAT